MQPKPTSAALALLATALSPLGTGASAAGLTARPTARNSYSYSYGTVAPSIPTDAPSSSPPPPAAPPISNLSSSINVIITTPAPQSSQPHHPGSSSSSIAKTTTGGAPPSSQVTPPPSPEELLRAAAAAGNENERFRQTTFWSCHTFARETHCGWHEPILDAGAAPRLGFGGRRDGVDGSGGGGGVILWRAGVAAAAAVLGGLLIAL